MKERLFENHAFMEALRTREAILGHTHLSTPDHGKENAMKSTTWMYFGDQETRLDKCEFQTRIDAKFQERVNKNPQEVELSIKTLRDNPQGSFGTLGSNYRGTPAEQALFNRTLEVQGFKTTASKGIAKALELSLDHQLPIDSHLIYGSDQVRVVVCLNRSCITLLILAPGDPPRDK